MPTRKISHSRSLNCRGLLSSSKAIGQAMYESSLERDYLLLLDFDRTVKQFEVQPVKIDMSHLPGYRQYTPDVLVHFVPGHGQPWLVEVKYEDDLREQWAELKPKFRAAIRHCRQHGWVFHLMTERYIRTPLLDNVKFLRDFRAINPEASLLERLAYLTVVPRKVQDLASELGTADVSMGMAVIWHAVSTGKLVADLEGEVFSPETEVQWHGLG